MGIRTYWHDAAQATLVYELDAEWTWEEFHQATAEVHRELDELDHMVSVIIHSTVPVMSLPAKALSHLQRLVKATHPREGLLVIVGGPALLRSLMDILHRVYKLNTILANYQYSDSLEEALTLISARRAGA